jgi:hypothetical protein
MDITQRFTLSRKRFIDGNLRFADGGKRFADCGEGLQGCSLLTVGALAGFSPLGNVLAKIVQDLILSLKQLISPGTAGLTSFTGSGH